MKGSVLVVASGDVVVVGVVSLVGVAAGFSVSFEGDVPVLGLLGSWL